MAAALKAASPAGLDWCTPKVMARIQVRAVEMVKVTRATMPREISRALLMMKGNRYRIEMSVAFEKKWCLKECGVDCGIY